MYPANYYALFPAFPRIPSVFVAMSFDSRFAARWENVIKPAVQSLSIGDKRLDPVRVDARVVGDSILTEILQGIGSAQLVLADITSIGTLDGRPIRNGNVMYEVGIAHAVRLPEEVLLFRSDHDSLLFDTANVRVSPYKPDESPEESKQAVTEAIHQALREVDLRRHLAVRAAADALDYSSFEVLAECRAGAALTHPKRKTMGDALAAISRESAIQRLLTSGLLRAKPYVPDAAERQTFKDGPGSSIFRYEITQFGAAVLLEFGTRFDLGRIQEFVEGQLGGDK